MRKQYQKIDFTVVKGTTHSFVEATTFTKAQNKKREKNMKQNKISISAGPIISRAPPSESHAHGQRL